MEKTLLELFHKYTPTDDERVWLSNAVVIPPPLADKAQRILVVRAAFSDMVEKKAIYQTEDNICQAYKLTSVKIYPKYSSELFSYDVIPDILLETERQGIVARGFFSNYTYELYEESLRINIPFCEDSVRLMESYRTPDVIESIIKNEFDRDIKVTITHNDDVKMPDYGPMYEQTIELIDRELELVSREYEARQTAVPREQPQQKAAELPLHPHASSLFDTDADIYNDGGICKIGSCSFNISEPEFLIGSPFKIEPTPVCRLDDKARHSDVTIVGKVFAFTSEPTRSGDKFNVTMKLFDGNSSIGIKACITSEENNELSGSVSVGGSYAFHGYSKYDERRNKFDKEKIIDDEPTFHYNAIAKVRRLERTDKAEKKRVELHLHTTMSAMDALIPPDKAVETAKKWGMPAVAITDHGNVQGFPEAMIASEKLGQKVIYGIEAYFVNDMQSALYGEYNGDFNDEAIVFDIETTGLSASYNSIIEIGAVKIKDGVITDRYDSFINPGIHIPEEITKLTSIDDSTVADARSLEAVLEEFLEFAGDRLLIAHNANFDTGFIRVAAKECGFDFKNPYFDTVALSRFLNNDLKTHKLDKLAEYFGISEFNHHRACDDAEVLADIYFRMVDKMKKFNITNFSQLHSEMTANSDPLKLPSYHQIILVKNMTGMKNLYKLISMSYLNYFYRNPRIPKSKLEEHREGLIIGSACESGELYRALLDGLNETDIESIVNYYDYLEIQPLCNNGFLIAEDKLHDEEALRNINRRIVELGKKYNKPVVATCDAHFLNDDDEIFRKILLAGQKFKDAERDTHIYFRTTDEMLEEFAYLGEDTAYEVVVENTNLIADMIEPDIRPIPKGTYTPKMDGAEEELVEMCRRRARSMYGDDLPELVSKRLEKELDSIIKHGFAVLYIIAQRLVHFSEENGYLVGSRGSVGSSFVATMAGISEVNPLPPHYWCPECRHSEFFTKGEVGSGFDLPDKSCPVCGTKMNCDGHDIPFETFLGFYGDKSPDIDLNFSGDVQGKVHKYTEELFGSQNVFRAGTLGTLADKTAYGYVMKYLDEKKIRLSRAEVDRLVNGCIGVKKTTGQHPGGIIVVPQEYEIYDFTPIQHPADDPKSTIVTTHFAFSYLHDTILKLDELGHDIPTKYKMLEKFSGISVMDVPMNDKRVYELFESTRPLGASSEEIGSKIGTFGIPEFGTAFVQPVVVESKPRSFADLLQVSGLTHGTDVWLGNAQELIKNGTCTISQVVGTRDGIMLDLIRYGLDNSMAFKIMEFVRKNKKGLPLSDEMISAMKEKNVPEWYVDSLKKIKYMFPKAHAAAYVMSAIRLGWFKIYQPVAFYCAMFTAMASDFDADIALSGKSYVVSEMKRIKALGREASKKEQGMVPTLELMNECLARGIRFLPVSLTESDAREFRPASNAVRLPFCAMSGLGESAAIKIIAEREKAPFFTIDDLQTRAGLNKSVIDMLKKGRVLDDLSETDQLSFF